jgi:acetate kinase
MTKHRNKDALKVFRRIAISNKKSLDELDELDDLVRADSGLISISKSHKEDCSSVVKAIIKPESDEALEVVTSHATEKTVN